tara:strand:- start:2438 stop:2686 length:249 start_codon:yes stop_codon:yes gene_type:complete
MKTLVENSTNEAIYLFADSEHVTLGAEKVSIGDPERKIISCANSSTHALFEDVAEPEDFWSHKYLYTESNGWELNPSFVDPR